MAFPAGLLLLLLLNQPWVGAGADNESVVCAETACYTAHWGKLIASDAQSHCEKNGGHLTTVKTEKEAQHIQRALAQLLKQEAPLAARIGKFWIGLRRDKGKCLDLTLPMKGFSWVDGGMDTSYTNWNQDNKTSCITNRCVSLVLDLSLPPHVNRLPKWSDGPCGSQTFLVNSIDGFVCKFSFKGMCRPLSLGGPGQINYETPFRAISSSLDAVPFASSANVACGEEGEGRQHFFMCREKEPNVFDWGNSGPLCVSSKYGCNFNNGGCQQDCFEGGDGSFRCGCRPGFRLLDDLVTCASRNPCSSNPCKGIATCVSEPYWEDFSCRCPQGYQLDSSQRDCIDVDECQNAPCPQECVNTPGSFRCECWEGYEPSGPAEGSCQDVDECALDHSPCAQNCTNTDGSFICSCQEGYEPDREDNTQCLDVNECAGPEGNLCNDKCINVPGSFHCGCKPGWELAPNGVSCIEDPVSPGATTGPLQAETEGGQDNFMSSVTTFSSPEDFEIASEMAPTAQRPSLSHNAPFTATPPEILSPSHTSESPDAQMESSTSTLTVTMHLGESLDGESVDKQSDEGTDGQKLLLFYILGTVVAILLLLALALGLLVYRKRKARREEIKEKKPQSATDSYSWAPERVERRATENPYSPTPGTDC